jgi:aminopeptidase N
MENVGCVTYHERFLIEKDSLKDWITFQSHILHELAHMWFGNLVTPKWWNELWLNESFATFLSFTALESCTPDNDVKDECWVTFLHTYYCWGLNSESYRPHSIVGKVCSHSGQAE